MTATRTALVTGAGSGIGAACTELLLARGHRVVAVDLRAGRMAQRADDLQAIVEIDVADAAAVNADGIDDIDIVVQCAAIAGARGLGPGHGRQRLGRGIAGHR